ncbi:MAG TPA: helix-turn-helix domain-containing protein [Verrucomicrobiae bacterium]|nr:helix-turn-helix domain-containing protein [Verrucomicrobiae bacterium]
MKNRILRHRVSVLAQPRNYAPPKHIRKLSELPLRLLIGRPALKASLRFRIPISFPDEDHEYLNITETAVRLKVTERTLRRWMKSGRLPFIRAVGRPLFNWKHVTECLSRFFRAPHHVQDPKKPRKTRFFKFLKRIGIDRY